MTMQRQWTDEDDLDDTVIRPGRTGADPAVAPDDDTVIRPRADEPGSHGSFGAPDDDTVIRVAGPGAPAGASRSDGAATILPADPAPVRRLPSIRVAGRVVRLDHPVVVGRRPTLPRVVRGPTPELVTVPSPSGQVSSSHVLVHADGEAAVVEDLRSTNGTVVRPAGSAPFRMPSGASIVVLTGTLIEIGDGNVIEVLSPHLRVGPADGIPPTPPTPFPRIPFAPTP
ncbi:FHA domain-containing protein [Curtobacterium sp. BH-2-1-1]|uniref:FHA domain-containing protein n=1 Tax=Curtobacterium sp. BH-2-1-1 TaxID=1905847 RepID=UPI0011A7864E|nr:FHA domain-containing protein [Curtobacterium sp. BH-2-1-1]